MNGIYHLGLFLFKVLLIAASPFNEKAKMWISGRKHLFNKIQNQLKNNEKRIWIHAASLGEFEQGRPIIEEIKKEIPQFKIVLTFFSPSGFEIQKNYKYADYVYYLPLDTRRNAKKFVSLINPAFVIFVKYEFWRNHLYVLKEYDIPTYLVSAIFRKDQVFFRPWGKWYRKILDYFSWFFVQNRASEEILQHFGFKNISISGDTRFDRVNQIAQKAKTFPIIEKFVNEHFTIIVGSSWKADEEILFDYINNKARKIKFIIAPHEIHESNIQRIISSLRVKNERYSKANEETLKEADALIIDNIGMLSSIYQYGKIAYIGGGFGSGIHNVLEAATFGLPTLFGPNYKKYQEAVDLIKLGGSFEVKNSGSATELLNKLFQDREFLENSGKICYNYIENKKGACKSIINFLIQKHGNAN